MVIRDLPAFNRRVRRLWSKRRFACPDPDCPEQTFTERSAELPDRRVLSARAGRECTRAVGQEARSVASLARWLGVSWATVTAAVRDYGTALIDDPDRLEQVSSLGIDETAFLRANADHPTMYVTGLVDLERRVLIDLIEGNRAIDVSRWLSGKDEAFLTGIATVAVISTRAIAPGCIPTSIMPAKWPTRSMSWRRPTAVSTSSAAGCKTSCSANTAAARTTRSTRSAGCC